MATLTPTYDTVLRITSEEKNARIPWWTWVSGTPKNKLFLVGIASGNDREVRIISEARKNDKRSEIHFLQIQGVVMKKKRLKQLLKKYPKNDEASPVELNLPEDVPLFIKFVDKGRYLDFIQRGELHFGKLSEYRNMALPGVYDTVDTIIGDLNEDTLQQMFSENTQVQLDEFGYRLKQEEYVTYREILHPNAAVFCFTVIPRSSLYSIGNNTFKINKALIERLLKDFPSSEKVPVVLNGIGYIWEMIKLSTSTTRSMRGPVIYTDNQFSAVTLVRREIGRKINSKDVIPFTKKKHYSNQNEYRFLLENTKSLNQQGNLEIGSLKKYTHAMADLTDISIQVSMEHRKLTRLEIYRGLEYPSLSQLSLLEFFNKCHFKKYMIGMPG
ncbi:hypothetical protein N7X57_00320 [Lactiplantibacillus paraplantarum]|uniref:hypothetical protein n=1 Tax=Lactiplantibacillus paraplantarum TaxID=60520 RepID=UPI000513C7BD|nr:hypothetical protein [Lactiplantibacillus paraplantarum]OAX74714.1 hypothetical protein A0U96_14195 [Lactiplantibacillus plantarum]ALO02906.1 hypothetical protein ASU28_00310 [Lactiplantibacillus paraplantarum]KGE74607.1 hypothetical protein HR47_10305 [Lactiplantibacillus paraplantarum]MCW1908911.1 hypothetical protein [Lactiplantibacillus paraplantarum]RDG11884.1 hypothetical protein DQM08_06350 [Lactiplantibacillus paraplantarum]